MRFLRNIQKGTKKNAKTKRGVTEMDNLEITNKNLFSMLQSFISINKQSFKNWLKNDRDELDYQFDLWELDREEEPDIDKIVDDIYEKTIDLLKESEG